MTVKHGGFISSEGAQGWYITQESDEVIEFEYPINSILIETLDDELAIQLNGNDKNKSDENLWYVGANDKEGIDGLHLKSILIHGSPGKAIRFKGLIA